jgi:hypothetical protein
VLRFAFYHKILVVLEKFPWTAEKNAYFVAVGGIFCSVKSI